MNNIVMQKTADLIPYINNARTHGEVQIAQIAASIREFGFVNPILTDGARGVIAGHGRLLAAKKLGMEEVPTIELSHLSAAQKKAYILADNRIALNSGWDAELLAVEIEALKEVDFDIDLLGFDLGEMSQNGDTVDDPQQEWVDMPDFIQESAESFHKIYVHFASQAGIDDLAKLLGQTITAKTKSIWHPKAEIEHTKNIRMIDLE